MIIVANTKELEEKYDLSKLHDDEKVIIEGGLKGKEKYNSSRYRERITYTVRQVKQIIEQMELIESTVSNNWNEYQKAKHIYQILGRNIEYNYEYSKEHNQQSSNLTGLLSRKAICAGYSLIYKEMMDRQGIECDYMRGMATDGGETGKHAWNVVTIDGRPFQVDLTWDSDTLNKGINELEYFGVDRDFSKDHMPDPDERKYKYTIYDKDSINNIDTDYKENQGEISQEQKEDIIYLAIDRTYKKIEHDYNKETAKQHIIALIKQYIEEGELKGFTRKENARENMEKYVSSEDVIKMLAEKYVEHKPNGNYESFLRKAVNENQKRYGEENAILAITEYIKTGKSDVFTRTNNARDIVDEFLTTEGAINLMIHEYVSEYIETIEKTYYNQNTEIVYGDNNTYFLAEEFAQIQLPEEKRRTVISRTSQWIKEKQGNNYIDIEQKNNQRAKEQQR